MGEICLLVQLHREGSAPAACTAGLFNYWCSYREGMLPTGQLRLLARPGVARAPPAPQKIAELQEDG